MTMDLVKFHGIHHRKELLYVQKICGHTMNLILFPHVSKEQSRGRPFEN